MTDPIEQLAREWCKKYSSFEWDDSVNDQQWWRDRIKFIADDLGITPAALLAIRNNPEAVNEWAEGRAAIVPVGEDVICSSNGLLSFTPDDCFYYNIPRLDKPKG